jgi:hypothetical protein
MCLSFPSDAFTYRELGVSSTVKVFPDDTCSAGIYEELEGVCARTQVGVAVRKVSDILVYVLMGGRT